VTAVPDHVDETGAPCARHPAISPASLYQLAMVGSRVPAFHHDCASKLQGLVMALDELTELIENGDPQLIRAVETALEASRELNGLLNLNRMLTRPAARTVVAVDELVGLHYLRREALEAPAPAERTPRLQMGIIAAPLGKLVLGPLVSALGIGRAGEARANYVREIAQGLHDL